MVKKILNIVIVIVFFSSLSCRKELPNETKTNQTPTTRLWISSENVLQETTSRLHIYYFGEDPDGYIKGYLIAIVEDSVSTFTSIPSPDSLTYSWITQTDTLISLPLYTKRDKFVVAVRAVDNNFLPDTMPPHSTVKGFPNPYWDRDLNGVYSSGDILLPSLSSAVDVQGAIQRFPVVNTPPKVQFAQISADNPTIIEQPDTTFTATTFSWVGNDDDGNKTLKNYRIALNDTSDPSNWFSLPSTVSSRTLKSNEADTVKVTFYVKRADSDIAGSNVEAEIYTGTFGNLQFKGKIKNLKLNSENVLYLKVNDIAGDSSATVRMPSTPGIKWYVKKPQSRMLVVGDYANATNRNWIYGYYRNIFGQVTTPILNGGLKNFDTFYFDGNKTPNYTHFLNPSFIKTLQLYDVVLWFADAKPNITAAQTGIFYYTNTFNAERNTYGHVIFTTQFYDDPSVSELEKYNLLRKYNDFAPLDSITTESQYGANRLHWKNGKTIIKTDTVNNSKGVRDSLIYTFIKDTIFSVSVKIVPQVAEYPPLFTDSLIVGTSSVYSNPTAIQATFFKKLYKRTDSKNIYSLDSNFYLIRDNANKLLLDAKGKPYPEYKGQLEIGIIDNQQRFVMMGLPLHLLNGWEHNLPKFFKKVIEGEFGLQ